MKYKAKFPRILLFFLSMAPFFVILGLMSMNIPICFEKDAEFICWDEFWNNTWLGWIIIAVSVVFELVIYMFFQSVCKRESGDSAEIVIGIKDRNFELVSFVTSIFLPLISFKYDQLSHWIVTLLIVCLIGYIYCKSNGYYTNPTLALFGYRLYDVSLDNMKEDDAHHIKRNVTILVQSRLHEGDHVRCNDLSNEVSYAKIIVTDNKEDSNKI